MRILLIAPTALDMSGRPIKQWRVHLPGLTLQMLAAVSPPGAKIRIINETVDRIPYDRAWDLVGLTGMGSGIIRAWQIGDEFRRRGRKVVIGGIAASLGDPELTLEHADSVVIGEAEDIWPEVVRDAQAGKLQRIYRAEEPPDINSLPLPRYDLMDGGRFGGWTPVQATRGCPHSCRFCSVSAFANQRYRMRPVGQVIRDVRAAKQRGGRHITLIDDNIGVDWEYCAELWEALVPENIIWMSQCSLRIADQPEVLKLARQSGGRVFSVGIESTNPASLEGVKKEWNRPERYAEAVDTIRGHGIDVSTEMMLGLDEDDDSVFEHTYDFLMDNHISLPRVHIFTPIPGTPLYEEMEEEGRILTRDYGRYSGGQVVFQPRQIDPVELQKNYWSVYKRLFTCRAIWHRFRRNRASLEKYMRLMLFGANFHYRRHIRHRIVPGIV